MEKISLKELRARYNLTQKDLALKIGVSPVTVSHWENGKFKLTKAYKLAIAYVLKIDWEIIKAN